jgi:hypothetical protein
MSLRDYDDFEDIRDVAVRIMNDIDDYSEMLEALAPGVRRKTKDRLIPLGKWWHAWKRGGRQKKETLRTHRNVKALRHGKHKAFQAKHEYRCRPVTLYLGEGPRVHALTNAYMAGV